MLVKPPKKSSFRESLKALEADIQHANNLYVLSLFYCAIYCIWYGNFHCMKGAEIVCILFTLSWKGEKIKELVFFLHVVLLIVIFNQVLVFGWNFFVKVGKVSEFDYCGHQFLSEMPFCEVKRQKYIWITDSQIHLQFCILIAKFCSRDWLGLKVVNFYVLFSVPLQVWPKKGLLVLSFGWDFVGQLQYQKIMVENLFRWDYHIAHLPPSFCF